MKRIQNSPYADFPRVDDVAFPQDNPRCVSMTVQSMSNEADVNQIVARAIKNGFMLDQGAIAGRFPIFGDFSEVGDFKSCLDRVIKAQDAFKQLPLEVRDRFNGDPGALIDFLKDPKNDKEALELGLLPQEEYDRRYPKPVVPDAPAAPAA